MRDLGGAAHHHPMLGAVVVLLQRQRAARLDHDALDLEALAAIDRLVIAPGPVTAAMVGRLGRFARLELLDQSLTSCARARQHQHRVGRGDDDQILDADDRGEPVIGMDTLLRRIQRTAGPCTALPAASRWPTSKIASQLPMSDQRKRPSTTAARSVFSITA